MTKNKTPLVHVNLSLDADSSMLSATENNVKSPNNLPGVCKPWGALPIKLGTKVDLKSTLVVHPPLDFSSYMIVR